jgi:predicted RNA binding protein YcfA (HicA-like mRNA interferase family)
MSRLPTPRAREVVTALKRAGFIEHHQKCSHLYFWHPVRHLMTTVPMHSGDLHRGLFKMILKQAGLSEDQIRELL